MIIALSIGMKTKTLKLQSLFIALAFLSVSCGSASTFQVPQFGICSSDSCADSDLGMDVNLGTENLATIQNEPTVEVTYNESVLATQTTTQTEAETQMTTQNETTTTEPEQVAEAEGQTENDNNDENLATQAPPENHSEHAEQAEQFGSEADSEQSDSESDVTVQDNNDSGYDGSTPTNQTYEEPVELVEAGDLNRDHEFLPENQHQEPSSENHSEHAEQENQFVNSVATEISHETPSGSLDDFLNDLNHDASDNETESESDILTENDSDNFDGETGTELADNDAGLDEDLDDDISDLPSDDLEEPEDEENFAFERCLAYYEWHEDFPDDVEFFRAENTCDFTTDEDGDGLAKAIDPDDEKYNIWYIVSKDTDEMANYSKANDAIYTFRFFKSNLHNVDVTKASHARYANLDIIKGITTNDFENRISDNCDGVFTNNGLCVIDEQKKLQYEEKFQFTQNEKQTSAEDENDYAFHPNFHRPSSGFGY